MAPEKLSEGQLSWFSGITKERMVCLDTRVEGNRKEGRRRVGRGYLPSGSCMLSLSLRVNKVGSFISTEAKQESKFHYLYKYKILHIYYKIIYVFYI